MFKIAQTKIWHLNGYDIVKLKHIWDRVTQQVQVDKDILKNYIISV